MRAVCEAILDEEPLLTSVPEGQGRNFSMICAGPRQRGTGPSRRTDRARHPHSSPESAGSLARPGDDIRASGCIGSCGCRPRCWLNMHLFCQVGTDASAAACPRRRSHRPTLCFTELVGCAPRALPVSQFATPSVQIVTCCAVPVSPFLHTSIFGRRLLTAFTTLYVAKTRRRHRSTIARRQYSPGIDRCQPHLSDDTGLATVSLCWRSYCRHSMN